MMQRSMRLYVTAVAVRDLAVWIGVATCFVLLAEGNGLAVVGFNETGFLVVASDRGFLGNQEIQVAFNLIATS